MEKHPVSLVLVVLGIGLGITSTKTRFPLKGGGPGMPC